MNSANAPAPVPALRQATAADVRACAALYTDGFQRGLRALFGVMPHAALLEDALVAYRAAEPGGFWVWTSAAGGEAEGYVLATRSLTRLAWRIALSPAIPHALWRLVCGAYGIARPHIVAHALGETWAFARQAGAFRQSGDAQIVSIAVRREARGAGAGRALMGAALGYLESQRVPEVRLEVQPDNEPAQRLYRRLGFVLRGEIPSPLGKALVMTCALPAARGSSPATHQDTPRAS